MVYYCNILGMWFGRFGMDSNFNFNCNIYSLGLINRSHKWKSFINLHLTKIFHKMGVDSFNWFNIIKTQYYLDRKSAMYSSIACFEKTESLTSVLSLPKFSSPSFLQHF